MSDASPPKKRFAGKGAVFLDRDGTIIVDRHYLSDPDQVELIPGAAEALQRLTRAGFPLFIVTNQSGIGRGLYSVKDMRRVNARLLELLRPFGVQFEHIFYAPESPETPSRGRKPSPQFLLDAARQWELDLSRSYMAGDKLSDVECGLNAGVRRAILVRTGYGRQTEATAPPALRRAAVVDDLAAAADFILTDLRQS